MPLALVGGQRLPCSPNSLKPGAIAAAQGRTEWSIGMTDQRVDAAIVVGVDGSASPHRALDWAASEAIAMHRPLRIVHCFTGPLMRYPLVSSGAESPDGGFELAAERVLADALERATSAAPSIEVATELVFQAPASALLRQDQGAELLVLGSSGSGSVAGLPGDRWASPWRPCSVPSRRCPLDPRRRSAAPSGRIVVVWIACICRRQRSGLLSRTQRAGRPD